MTQKMDIDVNEPYVLTRRKVWSYSFVVDADLLILIAIVDIQQPIWLLNIALQLFWSMYLPCWLTNSFAYHFNADYLVVLASFQKGFGSKCGNSFLLAAGKSLLIFPTNLKTKCKIFNCNKATLLYGTVVKRKRTLDFIGDHSWRTKVEFCENQLHIQSSSLFPQ